MRTNWFKRVLVLGLLLAGLGSVTFAQVGRSITADVPFEFVVGEKTLPAGSYSFSSDNSPQGVLQISSESSGKSVFSVVTRLAATGNNGATVVFDKVGTRHYLSEVWMPGTDGFLLRATAEAHTHQLVKAKK